MAGEPRTRLEGRQCLTGLPEDYADPVAAMTTLVARLLQEYAADGGDLTNATITLGAERLSVHTARLRASARLHGFTTSP